MTKGIVASGISLQSIASLFTVPGTQGFAIDFTDPARITTSGGRLVSAAFVASADTPVGAGIGQSFACEVTSGSGPLWTASSGRGYLEIDASMTALPKVNIRGNEFRSFDSALIGSHFQGYAARCTSAPAGYFTVMTSEIGGSPDFNNPGIRGASAPPFALQFSAERVSSGYVYGAGATTVAAGVDFTTSVQAFGVNGAGAPVKPLLYVNGSLQATLTPDIPAASLGWRTTVANGAMKQIIGGSWDLADRMRGRLYRVLQINRTLSVPELALAHSWLAAGFVA